MKIKIVLLSIKVFIVLLVLNYLIHQVSWYKLKYLLDHANIFFIISAIGLIPVNISIQYLKWGYIVRHLEPDVSRSDIAKSLFGGFTLGLITPARVGEYGRTFFISNGHKPTLC